MLNHGADIRFVQEMLGHKRLETTLIYTRVSIEKLKKVHRDLSGATLIKVLCRDWDYQLVNQEGSHVIL